MYGLKICISLSNKTFNSCEWSIVSKAFSMFIKTYSGCFLLSIGFLMFETSSKKESLVDVISKIVNLQKNCVYLEKLFFNNSFISAIYCPFLVTNQLHQDHSTAFVEKWYCDTFWYISEHFNCNSIYFWRSIEEVIVLFL